MKLLNKLFKTKKQKSGNEHTDKFSRFFLYASEKEQKEVLTEAARRANEDQWQLFNKARLKKKTG